MGFGKEELHSRAKYIDEVWINVSPQLHISDTSSKCKVL